MNKYLLMSAAALLASAGAANAGTHSFTFSGYCDGGTITTGLAGGAVAWVHTDANCASGTSQGAGLSGAGQFGNAKTARKIDVLSDNYFAKQGIFTETEYVFNRKLTKWELWICYSGTSCFEGNHGVLKATALSAHQPTGRGATSTLAKVAGLITAQGK